MENPADEIDIKKVDDRTHVRMRPAMYIGSYDQHGMRNLVYEIFNNSVEEAIAGYCHNIEITIDPQDVITLKDDGRGISTDVDPETGRLDLEFLMTTVGWSRKFKRNRYGIRGVGLAVVNSLSKWLYVEVKRDGYRYWQEYQQGLAQYELKSEPLSPEEANTHGTLIKWLADEEIFKDIKGIKYNFEKLAQRFKDIAALTKEVRVKFRHEGYEPPKEAEFYYKEGLLEYIKELNQGQSVLYPPIYAEGTFEEVAIQLVLQHTDSDIENLLVFSNQRKNEPKGTSVEGFRQTLTRLVNNYARKNGLLKADQPNLTGTQLRHGLTAVISILIKKPSYNSAYISYLKNPEARKAVGVIFTKVFTKWLVEHPEEARKIVERAATFDPKAKVQEKYPESYIFSLHVDGENSPEDW